MDGERSQTDLGRPAPAPRRSKQIAFAQQELRLISALVLLLGIGLFLALPFVLSIGAVVFLPVITATVLTIILSPLADKLVSWRVPNALASFLALLTFFAVLVLALALILQPATILLDRIPAMAGRVGNLFIQLQDQFAWIAMINTQLSLLMGEDGATEVVLAGESVIQQLAFATPSILIETLLTLLMTYFLIQGRVNLRRHVLFERASHGTGIKAARVLREVQDRVAAYILTVAWINGCVGVIVALGAWMLGVEAPVMWGGLAALLNFLPYIGPLVMMCLLALFGIGTAETPVIGLIPAAAYLGLHTVESNVVTPSILGARFTMNPVMILIALSYFSWIWGVFGALLSVPILLMLTAFFDHVGKPNLVGFIFGEPLFGSNIFALGADEGTAPTGI